MQIVCPLSSRRQSGVIVVPQFWQATTTVVLGAWRALTSMGEGASTAESFGGCDDLWPGRMMVTFAAFETRLLKAGQPPHPDAPPVPLHFPPPGHEPPDVWSAATYVAVAVE